MSYNIGHKYLVIRGSEEYIAVYTSNAFVPHYRKVDGRWIDQHIFDIISIPADEPGLIVIPRSMS